MKRSTPYINMANTIYEDEGPDSLDNLSQDLQRTANVGKDVSRNYHKIMKKLQDQSVQADPGLGHDKSAENQTKQEQNADAFNAPKTNNDTFSDQLDPITGNIVPDNITNNLSDTMRADSATDNLANNMNANSTPDNLFAQSKKDMNPKKGKIGEGSCSHNALPKSDSKSNNSPSLVTQQNGQFIPQKPGTIKTGSPIPPKANIKNKGSGINKIIKLISEQKKKIERIKKTVKAIAALLKHPLLLIAPVLLFMVLITGIMISSLMPNSVMKLFCQQYAVSSGQNNVSVKDQEENASWYEEIKNNLETFLTSIKHNIYKIKLNLGFNDVIEPYDPNYEYIEVLKDNKKLMNKAFAKSYTKAIEEATQYCAKHDYDVGLSLGTLSTTGSGSWKEVYQNCNYADAFAIINLCKYGADFNDFDTQDFKNTILDPEKVKHLYSKITYEPIRTYTYTDAFGNSVTKYYATIKIHQYDKASLYSMFDKLPSTIFKSKEEDESKIDESIKLTYDNMQKQMVLQIRAADEDIDGNVLVDLGFDNETLDNIDAVSIGEAIFDSSLFIDNKVTKYLWKLLKTAGLSDAGAAGMMGNLLAEHSFQTSMVGDQGSVGIAQWLGGRKEKLIAFAKARGVPVTDYKCQCDFLISELKTSYKSVYAKLQKCTDYCVATDIVAHDYEVCYRSPSYLDMIHSGHNYNWKTFAYSDLYKVYYIAGKTRRSAALNYFLQYGDSSSLQEQASGNGQGTAIANYGIQFVGGPYAWGGTSLTKGCDCSGFCLAVYAKFGYDLPHTSKGQAKLGTNISDISKAKAGDLIFYADNGGIINHVVLYIGNGRYVAAACKAEGIKIGSVSYKPIYSIRRIVNDDKNK